MRRPALLLLVVVICLPVAHAQLPDEPLPDPEPGGIDDLVPDLSWDPPVRFASPGPVDDAVPTTPTLPDAGLPVAEPARDPARLDRRPAPLTRPIDRETDPRPGVRIAGQAPDHPQAPTPTEPRPPVVALAGAGLAALLVWLIGRRLPEDRTRRRLVRLVRRDPGRHLSDLARELGLDRTTVRHHVEILAEEGRVCCRRRGRCRRVYPSGAEEDDLVDLLDHPVRRWIVRRLVQRRRLDQRRLREECDVAPSTLTYHAKKLEDAGLVERRSRGRRTVLALVEAWRERLRERGV